MQSTAPRWSRYDKLAGVLALVFMAGYYVSPIQQIITSAVHVILAPMVTIVPFALFVLVLSGATGIYSTALQHWLRDTERFQEIQQQLEDLQQRMKDARQQGDEDVIDELQSEQQETMKTWLTMMKMQFRPAVWSMLITIPLFLWVRWAVNAPMVAVAPIAFSLPLVGPVLWSATIVGPIKVWLVWYLGGTFSSTLLSRRVLKHVRG